ncbi:SGNH/GDSL hydrolase family protein [Atopomonas sediminilitoris]|uniref:SGNH/GDSL hydrolase family protein n=1 Tax=Atopomonas sediminilitoris TaxID=2919919 RepID=UPI001F4DC13F|nr:SGNH/GDSL hydrolase family protein [Atopomonas sediminilitoris]MCJ8169771.1 SGNH/GDSL hydrolase family protein [Atopomonas sediminilitoris]
MTWLWWASLLASLPISLPQALWTKRTALRLPEAAGPQTGVAGQALAGQPFRLLVLGESPVAGVGVESQAHAITGQLAQALSAHLQRPVAWRALGKNGITARQAAVELLPQVQDDYDQICLVFGVNDTTHFSSLRAWQQGMDCLISGLAARSAAPIWLTAVPPLQHFHALPWLLRQLLGWRAHLLDRALQRLVVRRDAVHVNAEVPFSGAYLARDGYHPSALGAQVWAQALMQQVASRLTR